MADHYFSARPGAPHRPGQVRVILPDVYLELETDAGVFSPSRLDPGTRLLLEAAPAPPARGDVLDLGCGYGPVACVLAARSPGAAVWAVDVNERALDLVTRNARRLGLARVTAARPDDVPADLTFATIWSNPPIRIGKQALHALLLRWLPRLEPGASAHLVVQRHLGADSLHAWLAVTLADTATVERAGSAKGYRVLRVTAPPGTSPA